MLYTYKMETKAHVIGLTGNIASGKSIVLQYLANFGSLTIDADLVAQQTYLPGNPAYQQILDRFGFDLTFSDGQINRTKLGRIVFRDPAALTDLEAIIHPIVTRDILQAIKTSSRAVVAIEAIKLFESGLDQQCQSLWAVAADDAVRLERLMDGRGMDEASARQRIQSQSPQEEKIRLADHTIYTDSTFASTYAQTAALFAGLGGKPLTLTSAGGELRLSNLDLTDIETAAAFLHETTEQTWQDEDIYRLLGQRTVAALYYGGQLTQLMLLRVEQGMAIYLSHAPGRSELAPAFVSLPLLKQYLAGVAKMLIVRRDLLSPEEAKLLGFTYGEDRPPVHPLLFSNVLRKHGLMQGEVYFAEING